MDTEQHSDRYWRSGSLLYIGVPLGDTEELTKGQYDTLKFDELQADIRRMRDERIDAVEWRMRQYQDEEILGLPHTDDIVMLAHHIQALGMSPNNLDFPTMWFGRSWNWNERFGIRCHHRRCGGLGEYWLAGILLGHLPHAGRTWNLTVPGVNRKIWDSQQYT